MSVLARFRKEVMRTRFIVACGLGRGAGAALAQPTFPNKPVRILVGFAPGGAEAALPGYEAGNGFGIFAPAGTPRAVVEHLNGTINKAMSSPEMRDRLRNQGAESLVGTPDDLAKHVRRELAKYAIIVKQAGVKLP